MKHLYLCCFLTFFLVINSLGQSTSLQKENLSDTVLSQQRTLVIPVPFDSLLALKRLFPGKFYELSADNKLISWECKTCKPKAYKDENDDGDAIFPYEVGVATRLINVMSYRDSAGTQYKMLSFNHSAYDEDGMMVSRFTGGLLGLAKFVLSGDVWVLKFFQPAIGAYGAFSSCPTPKPLMIGHDQYAFMIKSSNGGAGGPFDASLSLIAGANGAYQEVMALGCVERTEVGKKEKMSSWESTYKVDGGKRFFRDIILTMEGVYRSTDTEALPEEILPLIKGRKKGTFRVERRYVYKAGKGYLLPLPGKAAVN